MKQVKYSLSEKKSIVYVDRHMGRLRERESGWVLPSWQFELLLWVISPGFALANHFDLPGSQSIFGISQDPSMCAHASLSQDVFPRRAVWVQPPLASLPFGLRGAFLHVCG